MRNIYQSSRFSDKNVFTDRNHKEYFSQNDISFTHGRVCVHGTTLLVMEPSSDQLQNFCRDLLCNV